MWQAGKRLLVSALTPAIRWLRTSRPGHVALLAGLVAAWLLLYRINESLWEAALFGWLGLAPEERLSETLRFFFYDSIKIALLLSGIIFLVTVLRSYLSVERTQGPSPISNRLRCLPIGDVGGTLEAVTLAHQNVDIANPGQNITHRPLGPIKREEGGLLGMAGQPNLQPDLPSELTHAPALGRTGGAWLCRGGVVLLTP